MHSKIDYACQGVYIRECDAPEQITCSYSECLQLIMSHCGEQGNRIMCKYVLLEFMFAVIVN